MVGELFDKLGGEQLSVTHQVLQVPQQVRDEDAPHRVERLQRNVPEHGELVVGDDGGDEEDGGGDGVEVVNERDDLLAQTHPGVPAELRRRDPAEDTREDSREQQQLEEEEEGERGEEEGVEGWAEQQRRHTLTRRKRRRRREQRTAVDGAHGTRTSPRCLTV